MMKKDEKSANMRNYKTLLFLIAACLLAACSPDNADVIVDENDVPPDVSGSDHNPDQLGYRASLYGTAWPVDMANLNRSNAVIDAGLPPDFACEDVRVDTVEMPFPSLAYTRDRDEVFVIGGLPLLLDTYDAAIDGLPKGTSPKEPHLTKYNPFTGETIQLDLTNGTGGLDYIGGALVHENGYVYVISEGYAYKINPDTMTIAVGAGLPLAEVPGRAETTYNGLTTSSTGNLITKFFSKVTGASTFFIIDPDTLEVLASIDYPGASPRLTVVALDNGEEHLYHLNDFNTFRFKIGENELTLDEDWIARFDPYQTGEEKQDEPTSPVIVNGRVHYTTNTFHNTTTPMRIFWQETEETYSESDPPLAGPQMLPDSDTPGWNFYHLSIDDVTGIIIGMDQANGAIVAMKILEDDTVEYLWQKSLRASARPA
ncbi:MAG: hypothetical protein R3293_15565, partial [Candidatus Promineifilaceae bacterium]|nr:hypothetical protein [Candidatus Promineifilaceae bacterium]